MAPRYYAELCRQYRDRVKTEDLMLAQIAAAAANAASIKYKKFVKPQDMLPPRSLDAPRRAKVLSIDERERRLQGLRAFMNRFAGVA